MIRTIWRFILGEKSNDIYWRGFDSGVKQAYDSMGNKIKDIVEKSAELSRNRTVEELVEANRKK